MHHASPHTRSLTIEPASSPDHDAQQQDKLAILGHMATSIAHDLSNPLTSITTSIASILAFWPIDGATCGSRQPGLGTIREDLELMAEEAQRARRIIGGLLEFASNRGPHVETVSLGDVARATWRLASHHLEQNRVSLVCDCETNSNSDQVLGDPHRLQQVAMNLVINSQQALSANGERGTIWIRVLPGGDGNVHMLVEDDGPGVPPDLHHTIFAPYYTTKVKGTGLGLSIARHIVGDCHGTLTIEDRPEGGARFRVTLPSAHAAVPMAQGSVGQSAIRAAVNAEYRILLVDDEPGILKSTSRFLRRCGWTVDLAEDGHVALQFMREGAYDAVLSDLRMPGLNGEALYAEVLQSHPELASRMAFVSGDTMRSDTQEFLARCGCPTLQKPYELTELLDVLEHCAKGSPVVMPRPGLTT